ncbi:hypothetical protein [Floridanema evergladense]|uniref:Uncharacterized protein n=1 Tax=Floridaenema evergladense BLCC-F167 TaxID=3153639 RepID=A0ABV4WE07_9CYAN
MPNRLPDGSRYTNLGGCVRDINHVEVFLKEMRKVPETQILKLTASINPDNSEQPLEPSEKLPTRKNIVDSFSPHSAPSTVTQRNYGGKKAK